MRGDAPDATSSLLELIMSSRKRYKFRASETAATLPLAGCWTNGTSFVERLKYVIDVNVLNGSFSFYRCRVNLPPLCETNNERVFLSKPLYVSRIPSIFWKKCVSIFTVPFEPPFKGVRKESRLTCGMPKF